MDIRNYKRETNYKLQFFCIILYTVLNNFHNLSHIIAKDFFSPGLIVFNFLNILILIVLILHKKNYYNFANHLFFSIFLLSVIVLNYFQKNLFYQNNLLLAYPIIITIFFSRKRNTIIYSSVVLAYFVAVQVIYKNHNSRENISVIVILLLFVGSIFLYSKFVENLEKKDRQASSELFNTTLTLLGRVAELKDVETHYHLDRVPIIIDLVLKQLQKKSKYSGIIDNNYMSNVIKGSILHDIGKIAIDDAILLKEGKLSNEEFEKMKKHSAVGANLLAQAQRNIENKELFSIAIEIAKYHHEKWDGSGYPEGLKGTEIPLAARIMAVADVYDALISKRPYKKSLSDDEAFLIMKKESGKHFDPEIIKCFTKIHHEIYPKVKTLL